MKRLVNIMLIVALILSISVVFARVSDSGVPPNEQADAPENEDPLGVGKIAAVPVNANPYTESVGEAFSTGMFPERLTAMAPPKPFDAAAYQQDPLTYLETVEPGRVFQSAQPGPAIPELELVGRNYQVVRQGGFVTLTVKGAPKAPVTFTSFDTGAFENRLPSITVQSDDGGIATAKFYGTTGTVADVNILAGSPLAWGQVKFLVVVTPPTKNQ